MSACREGVVIRIVWEPRPVVLGTVEPVAALRAELEHGRLCPGCGGRAVVPDGCARTCRACGWSTQPGS